MTSKRSYMIKYNLSIVLMVISLLLMVGSTIAYFGTNALYQGPMNFGKIEITANTPWTDSLEVNNVLPGTKLTNAIYFSKAPDSESMYVRAKIDFSLHPEVTGLSALEQTAINGFIEDINESLAYAPEINNTKWLEVAGTNYVYLTNSEGLPVQVSNTNQILLSNRISIPTNISQLNNKLQYMLKLNLKIEIQAIQSMTIPTTLEDVRIQFRTVFENKPGLIPTDFSYFTFNEAGNEITGLTEDGKALSKIVIPSSYENDGEQYTVNSIGNRAFIGLSSLTSVTIGNSVTNIGVAAFASCSGLTSITIPNSVIGIGLEAFCNCNNLTTITISNATSSIGDRAFMSCNGLTSVIIPNSVTILGDRVFSGCSGLTSLAIGNSVTSIGDGAFAGCSNLTSITIPYSVTSIGDYVFDCCYKLVQVRNLSEQTLSDLNNIDQEIKTDNTDFEGTIAEEGKYITYTVGAKKYLMGFTVSADRTSASDMPSGITDIYQYTFYYSSSLTSVTIPEGVTSIGGSAFYGCSSLTSVTIPEGVTSIGGSAFYGCSSLASVTIPEGVTSIGGSAFSRCSSLTCVFIPSSVTSIGSYVFNNCNQLNNIVVDVHNNVYDSRDGCNAIIETETNVLIQGCNTTIIPENVTSIGDGAFYNCRVLTYITIPDSVISIGNSAFSGCSGLINVTIPDSVISIGYAAFHSCSSLTSITIPNSVTSIGSIIFINCNKLVQVRNLSGQTLNSLPTNPVQEIKTDNTDFEGTIAEEGKYITYTVGVNKYLMGFTADADRTSVTDIPDEITDIYQYAFYDCSGLTSITIPNSVTSIGGSAFRGCSGLTSITIPDSVTSIGDYSFCDCSSLTSITIPDSVTSIGSSAFQSCSGLTSITIPDSVTGIGGTVFHNCSGLISITIPNSVTSIGNMAFYGCSGLTGVTFENTNGWKAGETSVDVGTPSQNATYLKSTYFLATWTRSDE